MDAASWRIEMKVSRLSVGAIGFAILVVAINFAVIRATFLGAVKAADLHVLPHILVDPIISPTPDYWAVFSFYLLPMLDALLIGVYLLHKRHLHSARTVGFVFAGTPATLAVIACCLMSPGRMLESSMKISRKVALASFQGLAQLSGHGELLSRAPSKWTFGVATLEWTYAIIFAVLAPIVLFCGLPLLFAVLGGWVTRYYRPGPMSRGDAY
ncbi:hypothetical protein ACYOEI_14675 [Singulisphaera rosea]